MCDLKWILIGAASLLASSTAVAQSDEPTTRSPVHDPPPPDAQSEPGPEPESPPESLSPPAPAVRAELADPVAEQAESEAPEMPPEPRVAFGSKGQWVLLGSSNQWSLSRRTYSTSSAKFFDFGAELGIDSFVAKNVSIGFDLSASFHDGQGYDVAILRKTSSTSFEAGARFGFNFPLGHAASWWPRLTLGLESSHTDTNDLSSSLGAPLTPSSSWSSIGPWLNFYAPLLLHPVPHFLIGFGPRLAHTFAVTRSGPYDGVQATSLGASFVIGGWWGGPVHEDSNGERSAEWGEGAAEPAKRLARAFGGEGQLVLTTATNASVGSLIYSRSSAASTSVNLAPAVDYFLGENVSIGLDTFVAYSKSTTLDSAGRAMHTSATSFGLGPRFGVNFPLTRALSLWPQLEFGFGTLDSTQTSLDGVNQHSRQRIWILLSAPLLVHPSAHFFFGGGPSFFQELFDKDQYDYENDATVVGASFLLGGWL